MSRFSGSLNCPLTFKIAQGFDLKSSRLPPSSILPVVASSAAASGVLPVAAGVPTPPTDQDRGAGGQSARVSSGPLSSTKTLVDQGK